MIYVYLSLFFLEVSAHEGSKDNGSVCDGSDSTLYYGRVKVTWQINILLLSTHVFHISDP